MGFIKAPPYAAILDANIQQVQTAIDATLPALTAFNRPASRNAVRNSINSIIQMQVLHMLNVNIEQSRGGVISDHDYTVVAETLSAVGAAFEEIFEQEPEQ